LVGVVPFLCMLVFS
ncbi:hypothetical protein QE152_g41353, partial [Popillia japonica]